MAAPPRRLLVEVRWPFRRTSGVGGTFSLSKNGLCVGVGGAPFVVVADAFLSLIGVECAEGKGGEEGATDIVQGQRGIDCVGIRDRSDPSDELSLWEAKVKKSKGEARQ